ncbi:PRE_C2HC domain-containing protein [Trichonephila clavipes]|nr:PRE_C2HC domain-containing protein [Trichonephila clavipes]
MLEDKIKELEGKMTEFLPSPIALCPHNYKFKAVKRPADPVIRPAKFKAKANKNKIASDFVFPKKTCKSVPAQQKETGTCEIKEKIEIPLCINCNAKGHRASSTECPLFPKPRKSGTRKPTENLRRNFNAKHTSWGCPFSDTRGNRLYRYIVNNSIDVFAPPTPTRFGTASASLIDYALIKNLNWPCTINSISELSSDHNPIKLHFPQNR